MIAEGKYRARAKSWDLGETSTGKEQVAVEFEMSDPELHGQTITWFGYFTENAFERTIESLRACGWQNDDLLDLQGLDANEVELVVEHEEYEGRTRAKVRWVNRVGGLGLKTPMQEDKKKAFAASMRGKIAALGGPRPSPKSPPKAAAKGKGHEPPPHTDNDRPPF